MGEEETLIVTYSPKYKAYQQTNYKYYWKSRRDPED